MSKEDCLHCALKSAADEWLKTHGRAESDDVIQMIGQFLVGCLSDRFPQVQVHVVIAGTTFEAGKPAQRPGKHLH